MKALAEKLSGLTDKGIEELNKHLDGGQFVRSESTSAVAGDAQSDCLLAHAGEAGTCVKGIFYAEP